MSDFLEERVNEIHERMSDLKPFVDEHMRLEAVLEVLDAPMDEIAASRHRRTRRSRRSR